MNTDPDSLDQAVEKLKHDWNQLSDPDKALAVAQIKKKFGRISNRKIAGWMGCGESSIRRLLFLLRAPAADLAAVRDRTISTNEAVRHAKAEVARKQQRQSEDRKLDRQRKITEAKKEIWKWLKQEKLEGTPAVAVVQEARSLLIANYESGTLPHADPHVAHPAAEWIERCRPNAPPDDDIHPVAWYALWLARWSFCLCRDPHLATDALAWVAQL